MTRGSLRALMKGLIDYAGLFPPARLDMAKTVELFAKHRASTHSYALARLILPASRLSEFARCAEPLLPDVSSVVMPTGASGATAVAGVTVPPAAMLNGRADAPPEPWTLSVLIDGPLDQSLAAIDEFNRSHYKNHHYSAVVDTVEVKVATPEAIDYALDSLPEELAPFFEVPQAADLRAFATALAGTGAAAKIRTGGVTAELFPTAEQVVDFLMAMNTVDVPFKATAGLHHPFRRTAPLTYEAGSAQCAMHGFVNLFLCAAMIRTLEIDRATAVHLMLEHQPESIKLADDGVSWRGLMLTTDEIAEAREEFAICFGCCSFDDPIDDLRKLTIL